MKKFAYASLLALALVAMVSAVALADGPADQPKKTAGKMADNAADKMTAMPAVATDEMGKCCVAVAAEGKGCCGKDAAALKADYEKKVEGEAKKMASK